MAKKRSRVSKKKTTLRKKSGAPARAQGAKRHRAKGRTSAGSQARKVRAGRGGVGKRGGKGAAKGPMENPSRVSTGEGPGAEEVGRSLVEMFNRGQFKEIEDRWWSPAIVSVEGMGMAWSGRHAVEAKNADWMTKNTIVGASAEGPYVGASGFAVRFRMEVEDKATGTRTVMTEIGVYTVQGGKIVREEFMYGMTAS